MMEKLVGKPEGELWCFVKHTLSASMRLIEVGTKLQNQNKKDEAKEFFDLAYELFNIFWGIKLNIIPTDERGLQRGLTPPQIHADYNTDERGLNKAADERGYNADKRGSDYADKRGLNNMQINADNIISVNQRDKDLRESAYETNNQRKSAWLKNLIEKIIDCCKE